LQVATGQTPVFILGLQEIDWQAEIAAVVPEALFPLQQDGLEEAHKLCATIDHNACPAVSAGGIQ